MDPLSMQHLQWFVAQSWRYFLVPVVVLVPGLWFFGRWWRDRTRHTAGRSAIVLILLALFITWYVTPMVSHRANVLLLARELGLPPPQGDLFPVHYPQDELMARIKLGVTTRAQVHQVMRVTKARYDCLDGSVEKYLLYVDHYANDLLGDVPEMVVITYKGDGVVQGVRDLMGSADLISQSECSASPALPGTDNW
jgi:hypothetical protein